MGAPVDLVEFFYGLSYVLAGMFAQADLRESLVFKGGTALHKTYFPDYRFSVDLDFTALGGPRGRQLEKTVDAVARDHPSR